ncbi:phosphatidylethanolamine-binding protein [Radiomyces spectabilis]|uniref:phosphatidylethanolamine-binding protein n=1 Tax=Radiomyces spectabilis TaxID=64574 RepID=UPI00221EF7A3|nr:phosphatidylethanolamine-binding protein [Radiomyces spectabilis]KAI8388586.1 phosphatidylethanolamine-binding protein [Radiomyces spectabilis]
MPLITAEMNMAHALKEGDIIPQVLDDVFTPATMLEIKYPNNKEVLLGNTLTVEETSEAPVVNFAPPDADAEYTLLLVDPDAPSKQDPKMAPWRHWVIVNIPGSQTTNVQASASQHSEYFGPAPPPGTGPHRYIFLLYKQANKNNSFQAMSAEPQARGKFDFKQFAKDNNLELIAVNYFLCSKE